MYVLVYHVFNVTLFQKVLSRVGFSTVNFAKQILLEKNKLNRCNDALQCLTTCSNIEKLSYLIKR